MFYRYGNIGANEIEKIKEQPKDGFQNHLEAEEHLQNLFVKDEYPFGNDKHSFTILEVCKKL